MNNTFASGFVAEHLTLALQTPYIIGVGGCSASGKTALAALLAKYFNNTIPIISLDWFYKPIDPSYGPTHNWDSPTAFDWTRVLATLSGLKNGKSQWVPRHDYVTYARIENVELIESSPVILFEGIFALLNRDVNRLLDMKLYIECDTDVALKRRIVRDMSVRGYDLTTILERYETHVKPAFDTWIYPTRKYATFIIHNNGNDGIENHGSVKELKTLIRSKLGMIRR